MVRILLAIVLCALLTAPLGAQLSDSELSGRMRAADGDNATVGQLLSATSAARSIGDHDAADAYLARAWDQAEATFGGLIGNTIANELSFGGGVDAAQRAFREIRQTFNLTPVQISAWAGNFPELLASGEFDEMLARMSPDADDPAYRCGCENTIAWAHRLAGRHEQAEALWATLVETQIEAVENAPNRNAEAQLRGQYARNLARAGRDAEARRQLEMSMSIDVDPEALPGIRRRWAQTYAELGEVENAVEHLEALLATNSDVTVHTLESRAAWMMIRDEPAFQAMLERHR